jgi:phage I-like protein
MKKQILAILKEMAGGVPEEFQLLPHGAIDIEGEAPAQLTDEAAQAILKAFERRGNDLVIDYEHQTLKDVEAPSAGWIKQLFWRGMEGLWAKVEWTERAKKYLESREYRYFSPVFFVNARDRTVAKIEHVALTNYPKLNNLKPIMAKNGLGQYQAEEDEMNEKLKKLLGLAADAAEEKISEAVELLVNKCKNLVACKEIMDAFGVKAEAGKDEIIRIIAGMKAQSTVACKEVLDAIGAKSDAGKDEVLRIVAGMRTPATVAVELSREVARLKTKISEMEQQDLVQLALKEGKTSPEELDKWGRTLALTNPDQFKLIVLSRPAGSVIPVGEIQHGNKDRQGATDEVQVSINKMMGIDEETFKKYNAKA